jgi:hypothetical protein
MATAQLAQREPSARVLLRYRGYINGAAIFVGVFLVYLVLAPAGEAINHHVYLAQAMLHGSFDVGGAGMPSGYQDTVQIGGSVYIPFPPGPAILLLPFVAIWGTGFSQTQFCAFLGAVNVVLFWQLLVALKVSGRAQALVVLFFAFGTVHFYSASNGGVWQYNQIAAVFFLLIAIMLLIKKAPLPLVAFAFGFAVISRSPTLLAAPFFLYYAYRQHSERLTISGLTERAWLKDVALFTAGLVPFGVLTLFYNYARFDDPFTSGYQAVYESYIHSDIKYNYYRSLFPHASHFKLFDPRNIPLHLHALLFLPPQVHSGFPFFRASPYGMSVLLTSPAFVYAFLVKRKTALVPASWMAIGLVAALLFMHYSQGWVQYGYRFLLDFAPFLLILTAFGFDDNTTPGHRRLQVALVTMSVLMGLFGVYSVHQWATPGA